jgi:hypothetical protein
MAVTVMNAAMLMVGGVLFGLLVGTVPGVGRHRCALSRENLADYAPPAAMPALRAAVGTIGKTI